MKLSRRTLARSAGASLILSPFYDLLRPKHAFALPGRAKRLLIFHTEPTNTSTWNPKNVTGETSFTLPEMLTSMAELLPNAVLVDGLAPKQPNDNHFSPHALTGVGREGRSDKGIISIEQFIGETEHQIGWVVASADGPPVTVEQQRADYLRLLRQAPAVRQIRYLDAAGNEQLRVGGTSSAATTDQTARIVEGAFRAAQSGQAYFGPVYFDDGAAPAVTIAVADGRDHSGVTVAEVADKVIFNSVAQLHRHRVAVGRLPVGLRVNPGISYSRFDLADPARKHSRLGVTDDAELRDVAADLSGLMFHFNCENEDFDALATGVNLIAERYGSMLDRMQWISLGGGISFTTPGYPIERFCSMLRNFADGFRVQIYLEPGEASITGTAELVTTVLDVVIPKTGEYWERLAPILPHTDVFCPNDDESRVITGLNDPVAQARAFRTAGVATSIVTCGKSGAVLISESGELRSGSYPVEFVDGTGSGDAFVAVHVAVGGVAALVEEELRVDPFAAVLQRHRCARRVEC